MNKQAIIDQRFMAAAIRLARHHEGLTGTNPSVACVLVRDDGAGFYVVGSGITALGGRPHAEPVALAEAGDLTRGATAYVTLEPCAHHGRTPPCAQTLIDAGVARVVTAVVDPDDRVNSLGHKMLSDAGIEISTGCLADEAAEGLAAYLNRKINNRCYVTLKLALSADGFLGAKAQGQVPITGSLAKSQTHLMRARHHAIMVGAGTALEDDPELTCRLEGLEQRSPIRVVLDAKGRVPIESVLFQTASEFKTMFVAPNSMPEKRRKALMDLGCEIFPCEMQNGKVALPELLEDLASIGILSVMVEGGAMLAKSLIAENLVDELVLFQSAKAIKAGDDEMITSPISSESAEENFDPKERLQLGDDRMTRYTRKNA